MNRDSLLFEPMDLRFETYGAVRHLDQNLGLLEGPAVELLTAGLDNTVLLNQQ